MKSNKQKVAFISSIGIFVSILLIFKNYADVKKIQAFDHINSLNFNNYETVVEVQTENIKEEKHVEDKKVVVDNYVGILNIPKINFQKGFFDKDSINNNVDQNLFVAKTSSYPDVDKSNLVIAAHSGTANISFFRNLHKLTYNDEATITYKNNIYTYKVVNIYTVDKVGVVPINRDKSKDTLTLITCTYNDDNTQTVYIMQLINQSKGG